MVNVERLAGVAPNCPRFSGGRYAEAEDEAAERGAAIRALHQLPSYRLSR